MTTYPHLSSSASSAGRRARPARAARLARGLGRLLRGLAAGAVLAALLGGIPWGLWHYIGWPLPGHLPTWDEVEATLLRPMGTRLLLSVLACILWPVWFAFAIDVARATAEALRTLRWPAASAGHGGPLHTVAGILVGTVVLAVLGNRAAAPTASAAVATQFSAASTVPAPADPAASPVVLAGPATGPAGLAEPATAAGPAPGTVVVRLPQDGIYDSLWRIADRTLGDGTRWPEIYALNRGVPQPDGRALANPHLIRPGWVLRIPDTPASPGRGGADPTPPASSAPPPTPPLPPATQPPSPTTQPTPPHAGPPVAPVPTPPAATGPTPSSAPPTTPSSSPAAEPAPTHPGPTNLPTPTSPPATSPTPSPALPPASAPVLSPAPPPSAPVPPAHPGPPTDQPDAGLTLPTGAFVALSFAALVTAALFSLRLWRRRWYRPGSGDRDDLDIAPIVRTLRVAHDQATAPHDADGDPVPADSASGDRHAAARARAEATARATTPEPGHRVVGVRDCQALALDLARTRGLGLVGPGAAAALRALLLALLAERHRPGTGRLEVLLPAADATRLFGADTAGRPRPARLRVTANLDAALDVLEAELLTRARRATETTSSGEGEPPSTLVLVATPAPHATRRLQAVLDNGSTLGILGLLFGQWRPGATARVRADGTVGATSPGLAATLDGTRLFTLPAVDAGPLLGLLHDADEPAADREAIPRPDPAAATPATARPAAPPPPWLPDLGRFAPPPPPEPARPTGPPLSPPPLPPSDPVPPAGAPRPLPPEPARPTGLPPPPPRQPVRTAEPPPVPQSESARPAEPPRPLLPRPVRPAEPPPPPPQEPAPPTGLPPLPPREATRPAGPPPTPPPALARPAAAPTPTTGPAKPPGPFDDLEFLRTTRHGPGTPALSPGSPHLPAAAAPAVAAEGEGSRERRPAAVPDTPETPDEPDTPAGRTTPLALTVLGGLRLLHRGGGGTRDVTAALAPKQREAIAYLALHPHGVHRDTLSAAVWLDAGGDRPYNRFHATVSRLRAAMRTATGGAVSDIIVHHGGTYALSRDLLTVDLWQLRDALAAARRAGSTETGRLAALRRAADLYHGHLADDLDADWLEPPREALRRDVLDALGTLVHALGDVDLAGMLDLLERVRALDPHNEAVYRDIARVQARLGRRDAIPRTLALLATTLAEVGTQPTPETVALCEALQRPHPPGRMPGNTVDLRPAPPGPAS